MLGGAQTMAAGLDVSVDAAMGREEALCVPGCFEPLHLLLSPSHGLMQHHRAATPGGMSAKLAGAQLFRVRLYWCSTPDRISRFVAAHSRPVGHYRPQDTRLTESDAGMMAEVPRTSR